MLHSLTVDGPTIDELLTRNRTLFGDLRMELTDEEKAKAAADAAAAADDDELTDEEKAKAAADAAAAADDDELTDEEKAKAALGDPGKQALDRMKTKWQKERDRARAAETALAEATKKKPAEGDPVDADAIRAEADKAATAKVNQRIIRSEIRAAAAGKLADPKDALTLLGDLSRFDVDDDGNVDEDEIADAIDELLKNKPYLGVTQGDSKRFKGGADAGPQGKGKAGKPQLTEADVKRLSAQGKHAEIEQARLDGQLNTLLGIT
jgi:hypothetical protein